jgi:hypothetical protein
MGYETLSVSAHSMGDGLGADGEDDSPSHANMKGAAGGGGNNNLFSIEGSHDDD